MTKRKLSDEAFEDIRLNYRTRGQKALAEKYHVSTSCIGDAARKLGVTDKLGPRNKVLTVPGGAVEPPREPPIHLVEVPAAMARLAQFDPVIRRAMRDRQLGRSTASVISSENLDLQRQCLALGRRA